MKRFDPAAKGPLSGLKVLDLSRLMAGNMLSLQLGDFGAEVIKIEPPEGDPLRAWRESGESYFWKVYARNKRSLCLNLRQPAAKEALQELVKTADVFIENYRPGTLEAMGLGPDILHALNPRLVVVRISGFGQTGPYAPLPGFGTLVEAMSGFAHRTGFADREPLLPPLALADMIAGLQGAFGVMAALYGKAEREVIDLSLLEPIFSVLGPEAAIYQHTGAIKARMGNGSNTSCPRNVYRCGDGVYLALSGSTPQVARRIFEAIGQPQMNDDPRFATNEARLQHRALVDEAIGAWFAARGAPEALEAMRRAGATVGPIYDIAQLSADAHVQAREVITEVEDAALGSLKMHNITPRLEAQPGGFYRPAPALGADGDAILREAGLSDDAIRAALQ